MAAAVNRRLMWSMWGAQDPLDAVTLVVPADAVVLAAHGLAEGRHSVHLEAELADLGLFSRDELDAVQRELADIPGCTVLIYDQTCAAEKRRRRKRGTFPDPAKRVFINDTVCEGCGDCSEKSNCVSVKPLETELGRKRQIDQSNCNKDFSCVNGFCPAPEPEVSASWRARRSRSATQRAPRS